jgi:hypothetical protein
MRTKTEGTSCCRLFAAVVAAWPFALMPMPSYGASVYADAVLADNPVGYWRLGETNGSVALDSAPNGLNGMYNGGVSLSHMGAIVSDTDTSIASMGRLGLLVSPAILV